MSCKLKKNMGLQFSIVLLIFKRLCDDYQCLILIFSVIYFRTPVDISGAWAPRPGIWKVLFSLFFSSFFLFFSFLFFIFVFFGGVSLLWAPLAPGPLDIVHPCHPVATPLPMALFYLKIGLDIGQVFAKCLIFDDFFLWFAYRLSKSTYVSQFTW